MFVCSPTWSACGVLGRGERTSGNILLTATTPEENIIVQALRGVRGFSKWELLNCASALDTSGTEQAEHAQLTSKQLLHLVIDLALVGRVEEVAEIKETHEKPR